jgi:hypothetical protein
LHALYLSNDHSELLAFLTRMPNRQDPGRLPPLDLLAGFEAAARRLSFTLAAEERFITQSAISRQVKALEDDLGVPLFVRGHRSLRSLPMDSACTAVAAPCWTSCAPPCSTSASANAVRCCR